MKTAIIADIHGNLPGLQTVIHDIRARDIESIVCLGDVIEGGQENDAVVSLIRSLPIECIRGNHDAIHDAVLTEDNAAWLTQLPESLFIGDTCFTHLSPRKKQWAITSSVEAWNVFQETDYRLCFVGHLHYPALYGQAYEYFGDSRVYPVDTGVISLNSNDRYIISFGAIGYPRAGGRYLRYGIYDDAEDTVEYVKLNGSLLQYGLCV